MPHDEVVNVRYMVSGVDESIEFYTSNFGFELGRDTRPSFEEVIRGNLRLLLAGPDSSAGWPMPTAANRNRAAGTASISSSTTSMKK